MRVECVDVAEAALQGMVGEQRCGAGRLEAQVHGLPAGPGRVHHSEPGDGPVLQGDVRAGAGGRDQPVEGLDQERPGRPGGSLGPGHHRLHHVALGQAAGAAIGRLDLGEDHEVVDRSSGDA